MSYHFFGLNAEDICDHDKESKTAVDGLHAVGE
jgi:hypothetical protein